MWPFRRKKKTEDAPQAVQEYYQAERRQRFGVAAILAIVTLAVTVLIAAGLFFGGRAIYRALTDDEDTTQTADSGDNNQDEQTPAAENPSDPGSDNTPSTPPASTPSTPNTSGTTGTTGTSSTNTTPVAGPSDDLPSTGPTENLLAIFVATVLIGYLVHNRLIKD